MLLVHYLVGIYCGNFCIQKSKEPEASNIGYVHRTAGSGYKEHRHLLHSFENLSKLRHKVQVLGPPCANELRDLGLHSVSR